MSAASGRPLAPAPESGRAARAVAPRGVAVELAGVRFTRAPERGGAGFALDVGHLRLAPGERVACVGPSGAGKTTLVSLMAGLLVAERGTVRVGEHELGALSDAERRALRLARTGLVFQELALLHYLSARDNVLLPYHVAPHLALDAAVRARADALAEACGIAAVLDRPPARLSQGERQRVALCRALVTEPALVLCDEPTGNLDPRTAATVLDLLVERIGASGATLFLVTHDHSTLSRFDRVVDVTALAASAPASGSENAGGATSASALEDAGGGRREAAS